MTSSEPQVLSISLFYHLQPEFHSQISSGNLQVHFRNNKVQRKKRIVSQAWNINSSLHSDYSNLCHMHNNRHQGDAMHSLTPLIIQGGKNAGTSITMASTPASQEPLPQKEFFLIPQLRTQPCFPQNSSNMFPNTLVVFLWTCFSWSVSS